MEERILALLGAKDYAPATASELLPLLGLTPDRQSQVNRILRQMERAGEVTRTKNDRYIKSAEADLIPGRLQLTRQGKGFLQPDDSSLKEIVIAEHDTSTAMHGDRVLVRRNVRARGLRPGREASPETGVVVRILERKRVQLVGTLQRGRQFLFVTPDDPRMPQNIVVPEPRDVGRKPNLGDKVVVELQEWESRHTSPEGEIIEVLGAPDAEGVDMLSVLRQYNLPLHFPKPTLTEARAYGDAIRPEELNDREDCRAHSVITIDPDDAKDFDDAICLERAAADQWRLWVHIADVSHYVKPGTALDEEAQKRGNSTYLVDRVIPMLPEALSNELCSLKPHVERLTKCVEFLVTNDGRVVSTKFYSAVIHSKRRFTYQEVFALLQRPPGDPIEEMLHHAHNLAQNIRRLRFRNGSLALDFPETKIRLDEQGRVTRLEKIENDVSHQLIEEYMLLANEAVASRLMSTNQKAIYRVHEEPDLKRIDEFREDVLSHHIPCGNLTKRSEVAKLLDKLDTLPIGAALKIGFLRSLMRARYAVEPLGHYGLAKAKYTHFTSPIRRYADLVVHRAMFNPGENPPGKLSEIADHISETERNSADAERDSKDVKMYAFLEAQLKSGQPPQYNALVTDVRNFGFFVDVTGLAMSGLVHCSSLTDDFYLFDELRGTLTGRRNRRVFRLGDQIKVQIARVDRFKKQVDFRLAREVRSSQPERPQRPMPPQRLPARPGAERPVRGEKKPFDREQKRGDRSRRPQNDPRGRRSFKPERQQEQRQNERPSNQPPSQGGFQTSYQKSFRERDPKKSSQQRPKSSGNFFRASSSARQLPSSHSSARPGGKQRRR